MTIFSFVTLWNSHFSGIQADVCLQDFCQQFVHQVVKFKY
jgi:hypothetical protein